jgi:hypothetical protein
MSGTTATALASPAPRSIPDGLLRGHTFDFTFLFGILLLALTAGAAVTLEPALFWPLVALDLWFLGYHHVIATYTRLSFDLESFKEHRALILYLPPVVAVAVLAMALGVGLWSVATLYLYWQWFHYTRQSEGISKAYGGRAKGKDIGDLRVARLAFYAVPVAGILHVSARAPETFLAMPLKTLPVPEWLLLPVDAVAIAAVALWALNQYRAWRQGRLAVWYVAYMLGHFTIFGGAYLVLTELNHGWLMVNIWHNAQYILFVWLFNNRRFGGKPEPGKRFLSTIAMDGRFALYIATCLAISTAVYFSIERFGLGALEAGFGISTAAAAMVVYQTINFHHYIVDSLIWKLRKPQISARLGVTPSGAG